MGARLPAAPITCSCVQALSNSPSSSTRARNVRKAFASKRLSRAYCGMEIANRMATRSGRRGCPRGFGNGGPARFGLVRAEAMAHQAAATPIESLDHRVDLLRSGEHDDRRASLGNLSADLVEERAAQPRGGSLL